MGSSPDPILNADLCAELIKTQYPSVKIILVLRRQDTWCESIYRQLIFSEDRYRRFISFGEFFDLDDDGSGRVPVSALAWDHLVEIYYRVFGKSNVCVLPFELMRDDAAAFIVLLCEFMDIETPQDIKVNVRENARPLGSVYSRGTLLQRFRNLLGGVLDGHQRAFFELDGLTQDIRTMFKYEGWHYEAPDPAVLDLILQRCKESNIRLEELSGIDFGKYGYY